MKKIVLNLETGEYEPIKPHKRPTCCVPGCERKAHNLVGKGKYEPRVNTAYKNRFGGSGHLCSKHHGEWIKMQHGVENLGEVTTKNKLKREELAPKGTLYFWLKDN